MHGIVKRFPGVVALGGVDLDVRAGEVHCLLGQNGAGKSTLIKVLSASYQPDEGEIRWEGEPVALPTPVVGDAAWGSRTIYQELDLVPELSVAENIFLGPRAVHGRLQPAQRRPTGAPRSSCAASATARSRRPVRSAGCLRRHSRSSAWPVRCPTSTRLLVLDEPSAVLDQEGVDNLFRVIRDLTAQGVAVVYISHRLEEIREIGDRHHRAQGRPHRRDRSRPSRTPRPPS